MGLVIDKLYQATVHFDPTVVGFWVGNGRVLNPRCGQSE